MCEEDADDFCEDADDARKPEIADDEGEPLVAEPEVVQLTEPCEPPARVMNPFLALRLVYRTPSRRDLAT